MSLLLTKALNVLTYTLAYSSSFCLLFFFFFLHSQFSGPGGLRWTIDILIKGVRELLNGLFTCVSPCQFWVKFYPRVHMKRSDQGCGARRKIGLPYLGDKSGSDSIFIPLWSKIPLKTDNRKRGQGFTCIVLFQFVNTVEEMEKAVLVPQSLQDMSLSSSNGVVLEKSLFESFTVLRNIKNIVLTGMIFYVVVRYTLLCKITIQAVHRPSIVRCTIALCFFGLRDFKPSGSGDENGVGALKNDCEEGGSQWG